MAGGLKNNSPSGLKPLGLFRLSRASSIGGSILAGPEFFRIQLQLLSVTCATLILFGKMAITLRC
jgi:hypothetical protein